MSFSPTGYLKKKSDTGDNKVKRINFKNQSLIAILFIICVGFYLFLSAGNPLLHNHHEEDEHHHDCPACVFSAVASLFDLPDIEPVPAYLFQENYAIILDDHHLSLNFHGESFLGRAPPATF